MILLTKYPVSPKKLPVRPPGSYKDFRAEILTMFLLLFWKIDDFIYSFWLYLTFNFLEGHIALCPEIHFELGFKKCQTFRRTDVIASDIIEFRL